MWKFIQQLINSVLDVLRPRTDEQAIRAIITRLQNARERLAHAVSENDILTKGD